MQRALRIALLPHWFANDLHAAIRTQAAHPWDAAAFDAHADALLALGAYELSRRAEDITILGATSGERYDA